MKYSAISGIIIILYMLMQLSVSADETDDTKLAKALSDYSGTGEIKKCIRVSDIRSTKVIDDQHILFKIRGGKAYLNSLPSRCPRLASENRFSYRVRVGQLCDVDTVTVLHITPGFSGPTCGLGKFEIYEKNKDQEKS